MTANEYQTVRGRPVQIPLSVRFDLDSYSALCQRARGAGVTLSEYIRRSVKAAVEEEGAHHDRATD